ncbi:MAG TPA: hypothetical protein VKR55_18405 [Bradyrhizobium sp.]|uniref:hypothetical protein n=1 Tax=Bradyrhizobium sp. TaxID=376 RepID=UPI002BDCD970|nr:hypothetical protein [Bradyrhizobium sp.]HLZ04104.1 hypothetical protein [Bradyrhizobium sp.]
MTLPYLEALAAIAVSLAILMAVGWAVLQKTGHPGWVDTVWTLAVGLVGAGGVLRPAGGVSPGARLVAALPSGRLGLVRYHDPRHAAFAKRWGCHSARRMFVMANQAFGSNPPARTVKRINCGPARSFHSPHTRTW